MPTTPLGIPYFVGSDVPAGMEQQRLAVVKIDDLFGKTITDAGRCDFRLALAADFAWPVDGAARVPFDTEQADPAGIATAGASAKWTAPRNGRMVINWSVNFRLTAGGGEPFVNVFSAVWQAAEIRRGTQLVAPLPSGSSVNTIGTAAIDVTAGSDYYIQGALTAVGLTKVCSGSLPATWVEGFYVTS